jgi:hypothetical protein
MLITREWLDSICDDHGLTRGQQILLNVWCGTPPYVGQELPDFVAAFVGKCKGYRGMSQEVRDMLRPH